MLTAKQEKFVQNLIKGMSQREAYRDAYPNDKSTDETVDKNACNLLNNNSKVLSRYNELLQKAEDKAIMSAIERKKWLTKVINGEIKEETKYYDDHEVVVYEKPADISTKIKALDTLNKMSGEYITKVEAEVDNHIDIKIEIDDDNE